MSYSIIKFRPLGYFTLYRRGKSRCSPGCKVICQVMMPLASSSVPPLISSAVTVMLLLRDTGSWS